MTAVTSERSTHGDDSTPTGVPAFDITRADTWPEMLTVDELAAILRSSRQAVQKMINSGQIEAMRGAGRGYRISKRWVISNILHGSP